MKPFYPAATMALLGAVLLAAPASAQTSGNTGEPGDTRVIRTKWSLDQPTRKRGTAGKAKQVSQTDQSATLGPALPSPKVQRIPKKRVAARSTAGQPRKERVDATPVVANILRRREHDRNNRN